VWIRRPSITASVGACGGGHPGSYGHPAKISSNARVPTVRSGQLIRGARTEPTQRPGGDHAAGPGAAQWVSLSSPARQRRRRVWQLVPLRGGQGRDPIGLEDTGGAFVSHGTNSDGQPLEVREDGNSMEWRVAEAETPRAARAQSPVRPSDCPSCHEASPARHVRRIPTQRSRQTTGEVLRDIYNFWVPPIWALTEYDDETVRRLNDSDVPLAEKFAIELNRQGRMMREDPLAIPGVVGIPGGPRGRPPSLGSARPPAQSGPTFRNLFPEHTVGVPQQTYSPRQLRTKTGRINYVVLEDGKLVLGRRSRDVAGTLILQPVPRSERPAR